MLKNSKYKTEKTRKIVRRKTSLYPQSVSILNMKGSDGTKYTEDGETQTFVHPPKHFSIVDNPNETLNFFRKLERDIKYKERVFVDASKVNKISEDAILYLLSRFSFFQLNDPDFYVGGYFPSNKICRKMFIESGFTKFVKTDKKYKEKKSKIFTIRTGDDIQPTVIPEVINYVKKRISIEDKYSAHFYGAIIESMQNSTEHAYNDVDRDNKWWLIATPLEDESKIHYTFLDNGIGIPQTVKLHHHEVAINIARKIGMKDLLSNDIELILKALEGNFRSRTKTSGRGNGLPAIFDLSKNPHCENLTVISNKGMLKIGKNRYIKDKVKLNKKFSGTLITWDFINPDERGTYE